MNEIITFKEIRESLMFYCDQLLMIPPGDNSFLLYQYGPYLISNKLEWFHRKLPYIKNDILKLMIYVGQLRSACSLLDVPIKIVKQSIISIMKSTKSFTYEKEIYEIGTELLCIIQKKQVENKATESAMLNYSPIVQYQGGFVKPAEFTKQYDSIIHKTEPNFSELDHLIDNFLIDSIFHIMRNPEAFINVDHNSFLNSEAAWLSIPMDAVNIHHEISIISTSEEYKRVSSDNIAKMYFTLVYLRYIIKTSEWRNFFDDLFKINNIYNKISKGERINIPIAMESLSKISPSNVVFKNETVSS